MQQIRSRTGPASPVVLGLLHAVVAGAAVAGFTWWQATARPGASTVDILVQASGLAALLWAYFGLRTGLLARTRPLGRGLPGGQGPRRRLCTGADGSSDGDTPPCGSPPLEGWPSPAPWC